MCLFSFDVATLSADLLGAGALLVALSKLITLHAQHRRADACVGVGVCLGATTLFVFSHWVFLIAALLAALLSARLDVRHVLAIVLGFLLPHALLVVGYYYWHSSDLFWENFYVANWMQLYATLMSIQSFAALGACGVIYFFVLLIVVNGHPQLGSQRARTARIMLVWAADALVSLLWLSPQAPVSCWSVFAPMAYFILSGLLLACSTLYAEALLMVFSNLFVFPQPVELIRKIASCALR